jgi:hypothetical protein
MISKPIHILGILTIIAFLSNCTVHRSTLLGSRCNGNCSYQNIAYGSVEKQQIFGIGGNKINAMLFEAKKNLYRTYPLRKGQFYDNFVVDYKTTYYPFVKITLVTVTADVVIAEGVLSEQLFSPEYSLALDAGKTTSINGVSLSDSVVYVDGGKLQKGILVDFQNSKAKILVYNKEGNQVFKKVPAKKLFTIDNEEIEDITDLESGQVLEITSNSAKESETTVKEIIGLRKDKVLISSKSKNSAKYYIVTLEELKKSGK